MVYIVHFVHPNYEHSILDNIPLNPHLIIFFFVLPIFIFIVSFVVRLFSTLTFLSGCFGVGGCVWCGQEGLVGRVPVAEGARLRVVVVLQRNIVVNTSQISNAKVKRIFHLKFVISV